MNRFYQMFALTGLLAIGSSAIAMAQHRIPIQEDKPIQMYALGAGSTSGVFQFNMTDPANPTKLNGTTYVQYTGTPNGGGGTFLNSETVVGVKASSYPYCFEATAAGFEGNGPWSESYFKANYSIPGKVYDMTYDEKADKVYCWYDVNLYNRALGLYDTTTHNITRVGNAPTSALTAVAIDGEGQLWGMNASGSVYTIDKVSGVPTESFNSGVAFQTTMPMSAAIDPSSNVMFVVGRLGMMDTFSTLYKIDLNTKKAELVSKLSGMYNCLYIAGSTISEGAPAQVENLSADYNGTATVVTFTAPTLNMGGKNLNGTLSYSIAVDGQEETTGSVEPGKVATATLNIADGLHEISVSVSNSEGESKAVKTNVFSGYDLPTNISELKATADGSKVTLTWNAPTGENGGMLDMSKLTYTIERGEQTVAENVTTTTAENTVEGEYRQYTYTVNVVYNGEKLKGESVNVMAGSPYSVPYSLDLAGVNSLGEIGIETLDPNLKNTRTSEIWKLSTVEDVNVLEIRKEAYFYMSDFAYLPTMDLKAGVDYTLNFKGAAITTAYGSYKANLSVVIADKPSDVEGEYKSLDTYEIIPIRETYDWNEYTVNFKVEKDGTYNLGLLAMDQDDLYGNYYLVAKDLAITADYNAPESVTDLEASPATDNNRNITISFKLPTLDVEGNTLSSISKVVIKRGTEEIVTLDGPFKAGESLSYIDEDAPRGIRNYSVVVYNGDAVSKPTSVSVRVGYLNNLQIEALTYPQVPVETESEAKIVVKVTNTGFEQILAGDYQVVLLADGMEVEMQTGNGLVMDASEDFTFNIGWGGTIPATVQYVARVDFNGDENVSDNVTDPMEVIFQKHVSVEEISGCEFKVNVINGEINISDLSGEEVNVFSVSGELVYHANGVDVLTTPQLSAGVYVIIVGDKSVKVVL